MLHDLIFALQGFPGDIFKETTSGEVRLVPGLPFLAPSKEAALNRILHLSSRIISFKKFTETHRGTLYEKGEERFPDGLFHGCYLQVQAACNMFAARGVSVVVLGAEISPPFKPVGKRKYSI